MPSRPIHPSLRRQAFRRFWQVLMFCAALFGGFALCRAKAADTPLDRAMAAVLTVHTADDRDDFLGSAFLWGDRGDVAVTNAHVVRDAATVRLRDASGRQEIAAVIARDPLRDVAIIAVQPGRRGLTPTGKVMGLGARVWALGAPLGAEFTATGGIVSALDRQVDPAAPVRMVQHDAAINPGSSGGPLVDEQGGLVGMNSRIADGSRMFVGIAYAIPADQLARILAGLRDGTLPPLPRLGLRARPVDRQLAAALGIPQTGLLVDEVEPTGLGQAAGLAAGDVLLAIAGRALTKPGDLPFALEAGQATGLADMVVLRAGRVVLIPMTLPRPAPHPDLPPNPRAPAPQPTAEKPDYTLDMIGLQLEGTRIVRIRANSPASRAGMAQGDQVLMLNGKPATAAALAAMRLTRPAVLLVLRDGGGTRHVLLDPWSNSPRLQATGGANVLDPDVVVF